MDISKISPGKNPPEDINVLIEIPQGSNVKYEVDKDSGAVVVDRFLFTPMFYPLNYGFIPGTLSLDDDPTDVLVVASQPVVPGSVIRCRPIGVLEMEDESGIDAKVLAVPHDKLTLAYKDITEATQLPQALRDQIQHFFEHYKDLEPGKWVKVKEWQDAATAKKIIAEDVVRAG
ncbi:MAG: inorganic diphosphatase [Alphaproteobacteria bacterium CG_4_10_14_0_2_um_filter_63_37]|nr:MAG: inorganic pyrophosphatase [Proteobacteria bacterium CG1_02_64_396]PJA25429.1 MAG: inorganic diphosphatase [Alphaproteobacteria bacterium CG_4_10_14_0_2_um_filter_63_37]